MIFKKKKTQKTQEPTNTFGDGLTNLTNQLANQRNAALNNRFQAVQIDRGELREMYRSGVPSKIYRLKTGYALKNTLVFKSSTDEPYYKTRLEHIVKKAAMFQLGFGRGLVVLFNEGDDLTEPLTESFNPELARIHVFSGDMVTAGGVSLDLQNPRYYKPIFYVTRGVSIHWTRCVDFTYVEPVEVDKPTYQYGSISEGELIYNQLINDAIIQRSNTSIIEKVSSVFYKVKGFKQLLQMKNEGNLLQYFSNIENLRSIYGAGVIDLEDSIETVTQQLNGLKEMDDTSLRRLALVTGIPIPILVGENVKGLNSVGENERQTLNDTISSYQNDYLKKPINQLMHKLGKGYVSFKEGLGMSSYEQANYEKIIIANALQLQTMGEDFDTYLLERGILKDDEIEKLFRLKEDNSSNQPEVVESNLENDEVQ